MATKNTTLRNKMATDFGALWNSGTLVLKTSGGVTLATFNLGSTAFGSATTGKIAANGVPISTTGATNGTAAIADLISSGSTYTLTGLTVGTSAANVIIDNTSIVSGQTVQLTKLEWTEAANIA
jgi:hypothetical protein